MITIKDVEIEIAVGDDSYVLSEIAFNAKRHWNYPEDYFRIWKDELTVTPGYLSKNRVYKAQFQDEILGFCSIYENESDFYSGEILVQQGFWLEHVFIKPDFHGRGIGRLLVNHAKEFCRQQGISSLLIFVDPFATGFYKKLGAKFLYDSKSSIPNRTIPVYELKI